jgi:carboxyl-terminal processing protease
MKRYCLSLLLAFVLVGSGQALAKISEVPFDELVPYQQHRQTALIITKVIDRFHYRKASLDDAMSSSILERYLESLDPNKSFFHAGDVADFERYRSVLDDALRKSQLDPAYRIFRRFRLRVDQRVDRALSLLDQAQFDFTKPEEYRFDRAEAEWAPDEAGLDDLWRRRIKNDILSLRLAGKDEEKIKATLTRRYEGIRRRVRQFTSDDVFQSFINAYTLSIEPHTSFMSPRTSENFDISMRLSLQGIGAVLRSDNEYTLIQRTVPGGPAARSGELQAGDRIVGVAQGNEGEMEDVIGWRLQDVVDLIRGPKDSVVRLAVIPENAGADGPSKEVVIVRDKIKLEDQAAKSEIVEGIPGMKGLRIGVIEIPAFYRDFRAQAAGERDFRSTTRDVRRLLGELKREEVDGVIVDLRGNGGGSLTEATELTGLFIETGPVVQVKDADGEIDVERDTDPDMVYEGPLAVLVDRNSASASEIFAGAMQDYQRGLVIGEPTFGKGTVQTLVDLGRFVKGDDDLGRLRLTMAQFFRVNGGSTQHRGVMPDIVYPTAKGAASHGERALENALPWASIRPVDHRFEGLSAVAGLRDLHIERIGNDPGFQFLLEQEDEIEQIQSRHTVSLVESVRRTEWQGRERARLERRNRLRAHRGLEPLKSLEVDEDDRSLDDSDDPEDVAGIMLEETALILSDHVNLSSRTRTAQTGTPQAATAALP